MKTEEGATLIVKEFLLNLTTQRAFVLFFIAFALGASSIFFDFGLPWLPAAVVLAYGATLLYCATALQVSHSEATNNSPYFLGFVFFLASLLKAFYSVSLEGGGQLDTVIHQLGAALLTTIVGLPLRQALFAYSPSQADQDLFFRDLEEQLRRSAAEFRRSQVAMVELIKEFVASRRSLLNDETLAIQQYVNSLSKAAGVLDGSINSYPNAISATLESCTKRFGELDGQIQKLATAARSVDGAALKVSLESLPTLGAAIKELDTSIATLRTSLLGAKQSADSMPGNFQRQLSDLAQQLSAIPLAAREQIAILKGDISNIDQILNSFIVLLKRRIEAIK
jgi:hypothetical protein